MGMKSTPQMPPPVDPIVTDKTTEAEAKLSAEKEKMLSSKKQGMYGTILTSGQGVTEEANTEKTVLGGGIK
jgi:hypothetical protein